MEKRKFWKWYIKGGNPFFDKKNRYDIIDKLKKEGEIYVSIYSERSRSNQSKNR